MPDALENFEKKIGGGDKRKVFYSCGDTTIVMPNVINRLMYRCIDIYIPGESQWKIKVTEYPMYGDQQTRHYNGS